MELSADNNASLTLSCLHRPKLAVVIIYEGRAAGPRAKYFYESLARDLRGKYEANLDLWNLPILAISQIGNLAGQVAAKADVVILSLSGDADLPAEIRGWIEPLRVKPAIDCDNRFHFRTREIFNRRPAVWLVSREFR